MPQPLQKILFVEDEPDIRTVAELALSAVGGFTVETCDGGETALAKAPVFRPDLILLDVMMPGMDGPTTLANLRKMAGFETIPIIFITAKAMPSEIAHFKALGAADIIPKPFDPMTLADQVRAIWDRLHG